MYIENHHLHTYMCVRDLTHPHVYNARIVATRTHYERGAYEQLHTHTTLLMLSMAIPQVLFYTLYRVSN